MVVCGYLFEILIIPFGGLDFSIYRMGAMTIFDNEGFTKDLYAPVFIEIGGVEAPLYLSAVCGSRLPALCVPAA